MAFENGSYFMLYGLWLCKLFPFLMLVLIKIILYSSLIILKIIWKKGNRENLHNLKKQQQQQQQQQQCFVSLPGSAVGWSVVYDCGFSWLYSLAFFRFK